MLMSIVEMSVAGPIATLTIDNKPVNALNSAIVSQLLSHLQEIEKDDELKVVLITGKGEKAFVAGADIKEFPQFLKNKKVGEVAGFAGKTHEVLNKIDHFPKPIIAVINGLALGGGCELALACDFRIAADTSKLGLPEINLGLLPGGGGTQRLPRLIGTAKAKRMMFLGETISAQEAEKIGLIDEIAPPDKLMECANQLAGKLVDKPAIAITLIKELVNRGSEIPQEEALRKEVDYFERVFFSEDAREGITAFIEKRKPEFNNR